MRSVSCSITHTHTHTRTSLTLSEEKYPVEVMILAVDFLSGQEVYPQIAEKIQALDIGVLGKNLSQKCIIVSPKNFVWVL